MNTRSSRWCGLAFAAWCLLAPVHAQAQAPTERPGRLHNVVHLTASATVEAQQDWLRMSLAVTREGAQPTAVQEQLKKALESALPQARALAQAGQMQVRSGAFSVTPHYGREGKITGWQGSAELVLEGRDFARIGQAAAQLELLTVQHLEFSLSQETKEKLQSQAQAQALARFQSQATEISKGLGFSSYSLLELTVGNADGIVMPRQQTMRFAAMSAPAAAPASPMSLEAGLSKLTVEVSGSVQLR